MGLNKIIPWLLIFNLLGFSCASFSYLEKQKKKEEKYALVVGGQVPIYEDWLNAYRNPKMNPKEMEKEYLSALSDIKYELVKEGYKVISLSTLVTDKEIIDMLREIKRRCKGNRIAYVFIGHGDKEGCVLFDPYLPLLKLEFMNYLFLKDPELKELFFEDKEKFVKELLDRSVLTPQELVSAISPNQEYLLVIISCYTKKFRSMKAKNIKIITANRDTVYTWRLSHLVKKIRKDLK